MVFRFEMMPYKLDIKTAWPGEMAYGQQPRSLETTAQPR